MVNYLVTPNITTSYGSENKIIAKINDEIIGEISIAHRKDINAVALWNFYVKEKYQGNGIGRKLIKMAKEENKNHTIILSTMKDTAPIAFKLYLSEGFFIVKEKNNVQMMKYKEKLL